MFVDPVTGVNSGAGDITAPFRTVEYAFSRVSAGGTIVLRAGEYHEGKVGTASVYAGIALQTSNVTVQSYPDEIVWFDGSSIKTGWVVHSTGVWRLDGWTVAFDRSPTYSFGAADDPRPGWSFINPSYPTAAWPERVFIDGVALLQTTSLANVTAGKFYIDQAADKVYIGSNPIGHEVRITDLQTTITALATGITFRGFGVRRFAPSQPHLGAVKTLRSNCTMENLWFEDISCVAVAMQGGSNIGSGCLAKNITILRSGSVGLSTTATDGLIVSRANIQYSNIDHFNYAPATGAIKTTRTRGVTVKECNLSNNYCKGLWMDESVSNILVHTTDFLNNEQRGVTFELSGITKFYNNFILNAGYNGVDFINCDEVHAWNNTIVNSGAQADRFGASRADARSINVVQDNRAPMTSSSVGVDTRYAVPHPDGMDWITTSVERKNNLLARMTVGQALTAIEDYNKNTGAGRTWGSGGFNANDDGNFYNRPTGTPSWLALLANAGSANPSVYFNLTSLVGATGLDANSTLVDGADALNPDYTLNATYKNVADSKAVALPSSISAIIGQATGVKHVGCWR